MPTFIEAALALGRSAELSIVVKATVLLVLGIAATRLAPRARASVRHVVLASTFGALLALPLAVVIVPAVAIEIPAARGSDPVAPLTTGPGTDGRGGLAVGGVSRPLVSGGRSSPLPWLGMIRAAWIAGATLLFVSLVGALWRLSRVRRYGLPWPERSDLVTAMAAEAGLRQPVELLLHENIAAPLTCGFRRPTILLPSDAGEWNEVDLRRALVHELEHVRRGDWVVQMAARATCAAYWFHPLVWVAWRRLCLEAERACDDAVLQGEKQTQAEQTEYAEQLVVLAQRLSNAPAQPAVAMASRSDLSARVSALLAADQQRGRAGLLPAAAALTAAALVMLAIAPLRAVAAPRNDDVSIAPVEAAAAEQGGQRRRVTPLDRALIEAAGGGDLGDVTVLLDAGANVNSALDGDGSPLIVAARSGSLEVVRLLLDRGADPNMPVSGDGNPIIMAASEGHADIIDLLLDRGANIDQIVDGDENALIQASAEGHLEVVKLLVTRGADVNARAWARHAFGGRNGEWRTPLSMARRGRHGAVVAFLLSAGARE